MKINVLSFIWSFLTGYGAGVADYLFSLVNTALAGLGDASKEKIVATLNFVMKVMSIAEAIRVFIPAKWQIAYNLTLDAIRKVVASLQDLEITGEELQAVLDGYTKAYNAWKGADDDTCCDPALELKAA